MSKPHVCLNINCDNYVLHISTVLFVLVRPDFGQSTIYGHALLAHKISRLDISTENQCGCVSCSSSLFLVL